MCKVDALGYFSHRKLQALNFQPTYGDNPMARNRGQVSNHQGQYK